VNNGEQPGRAMRVMIYRNERDSKCSPLEKFWDSRLQVSVLFHIGRTK